MQKEQQVLIHPNQQHTDKSGIEKKTDGAVKKIPDTSGLVKETDHNAKITEIESKVPRITGLATTAEKKIPNVSDLVNKIDYDAKT